MEVHMQTDIGKLRDTNEDAVGIFYNKSNQLLAIVADGMGGHQAGEIASTLAISFVKELWESTKKFSTKIESESWLQSCVEDLNSYILKKSKENENYNGMGTTVVMSMHTDDFVTIAHVGDSRCYFLENEKLELKTCDHSYVYELVKNGEITLDEAENHPKKNMLLRVIGTESIVEPAIASFDVQAISHILLCSDGLTNKVTHTELEDNLKVNNRVEEKTQYLINLANERGGEDNISVIIIHSGMNEEGEQP